MMTKPSLLTIASRKKGIGRRRMCVLLLLILQCCSITIQAYVIVSAPSGEQLARMPLNPTRPTNRNRHCHNQWHHSFRLDLTMNPNDLESEEEREERMKFVRQIQKSFYQREEQPEPKPPTDGDTRITSMFEEDDQQREQDKDHDDPAVLHDVPLWRVQWTELPGYQNVLNVHVPHYTHMFHTVFARPKPWYFGHVQLPGGSENMENPLYRLPDLDKSSLDLSKEGNEATLVGTLMQVSDYKLLDDGRLALIVQSLERFEIVGVTQHIPYAIAAVKRLPDNENFMDGNNDEWREFEFRPTLWDDLIPSTPSAKQTASSQGNFISVSPLVNYDGSHFPNELDLSPNSGTFDAEGDKEHSVSFSRQEDAGGSLEMMLKMERNVWIALDTMLRLLTTINPQLQIPVPSQLLGLLPIEKESGSDDNDTSIAWPIGFKLEEYATQLQANNAIIGTTSKSPFIRVSENTSYPMARRAARLSYSIWIILESISMLQGSSAGSPGPSFPTKQQILEETSIYKRLQMAYDQLEVVNTLLRQTLQ